MQSLRKLGAIALILVSVIACTDGVTSPVSAGDELGRPDASAGVGSMLEDAPLAALNVVGARPTIRLFVVQGSGLFEILDGSGTGGRFTRQARACAAVLRAHQACPAARSVAGYTDRVQRGETMAAFITAAGELSRIGLSVGGRIRNEWRTVRVPAYVTQLVPRSPVDDDLTMFAQQGGMTESRRVPVGTRP